MVESISTIRQMMAESKFNDAEKAAELQLRESDKAIRKLILPLYVNILTLQKKKIRTELIIENATYLIDTEIEEAAKFIERIEPNEVASWFIPVQILKMKLASAKGQVDELYKLIFNCNVFMFSEKIPLRNDLIESFRINYFKNDFQLKLQSLAISLMLNDLRSSEEILRDLVLSCIEGAGEKDVSKKLLSTAEVINSKLSNDHLVIYENFCIQWVKGVTSKKDYKKIVEMIIYFDDFKFQVLVLALVVKLGLSQEAQVYAGIIKKHVDFDFVYLEKYFVSLKFYFIQPRSKHVEKNNDKSEIDLKVDKKFKTLPQSLEEPYALLEEEQLIIHSLKLDERPVEELIELTISFIQVGFLAAAVTSSDQVMNKSKNQNDYLKACFLKLTCLYRMGDFRAALDLSHQGLSRTTSQEDKLSFLYLQAEALNKMGMKGAAKKVLGEILQIDPNYRLTKERLERLNEV